MNNYWMLEVRQQAGTKRAVIGSLNKDSITMNWFSGETLNNSNIPEMVFQFGDDGGSDLTDFFPSSIPLISEKMLLALKRANITNIESFPVTILDKRGKSIEEKYFAINIRDKVACADLDASDCECDDYDDPIGVDFDSLVIDEERAKGHLFFRLSEAVNGIVVHESVRAILEPLNLRGIVFIKPEDWIG